MADGSDRRTAIPAPWRDCSPRTVCGRGPLGTVRVQGRAAIEELFRQFQVIPFIIHNVMNPLIEIDGDQARGEWHAMIATTAAEGQAFWTFGRYLNEYRRTPDGWRYTRMALEAASITTYEKRLGR